jgi:hypothetical protein
MQRAEQMKGGGDREGPEVHGGKRERVNFELLEFKFTLTLKSHDCKHLVLSHGPFPERVN